MDEVLKDKRFAHIAKDPRYRRIPRGERKVKIDKRFKSMFKDKSFKLKYSVDKRGRPVNLTSNENLKKYYELSDDDDDDQTSSNSDGEENKEKDNHADVARHEEKSHGKTSKIMRDIADVDDDADDGSDDDDDDDDDDDGEEEKETEKPKERKKQLHKGRQKKKAKKQNEEEDSESDESSHDRGDASVDFARGEGNIESSSSEEEDGDDEDDICSGPGLKEELDHKWGEIDQNVERAPDATRRLAMCNMDWDRVKAKDIFMLLHSFKPTNGVIHSVKIYPSEFGKERMAEENAFGPKELRETKLDSDEEEGTVEDKEGTSYHTEKLRQYQLNRLKYYYAVVECDNVETANNIYGECDGMEYETSSTKLDLRFIPDDMSFEDDARSECTELPAEYTPSLFTNAALSQSKVDLTWDETDRTRVQLTSKQFTAKNKEVDDADLQAYLASSSDEEVVDYGKLIEASDRESESEDEEQQIEKYKQLLQDIDKNEDRKKKKDVQMEITWEPGLREATEGIIKKVQTKALSPWEEYLQKKKDKKEKKREERTKKQQRREQQEENSDLEPDQDLDETGDDQAFSDDDLPADFDQSDPFFVRDDLKKKKTVKEKKKKKTKKRDQEDENEDQEKAELSLLMMEEREDNKKHFSLEKLIDDSNGKKKRKKKEILEKKKKKQKDEEDFEMQLDDPRFSAVYSSHLYNIDPSAPEYRKTQGTEAMIQEKLKRNSVTAKKHKLNDSSDNSKHKKRKSSDGISAKVTNNAVGSKPFEEAVNGDTLDSLVKSVKAKTKQFHSKKKR